MFYVSTCSLHVNTNDSKGGKKWDAYHPVVEEKFSLFYIHISLLPFE